MCVCVCVCLPPSGNVWYNAASQTITVSDQFNIAFEYTFAGGYAGDAAIDDVIASLGKCPTVRKCPCRRGYHQDPCVCHMPLLGLFESLCMHALQWLCVGSILKMYKISRSGKFRRFTIFHISAAIYFQHGVNATRTGTQHCDGLSFPICSYIIPRPYLFPDDGRSTGLPVCPR